MAKTAMMERQERMEEVVEYESKSTDFVPYNVMMEPVQHSEMEWTVGMERMAYALFSQHGPALADWPRDVLEYLELDA